MTARAQTADVLVLGVGGMGSAACYHLARRGAKVIGLEQHTLGHALGSSHGETRLIRQAYFEHSAYVPLLRRAYELWRELERESGRTLFHQNGLVIFGPKTGGRTLPGVRESSRLYGVPLVEHDRAAALGAWPEFVPPADHTAVLEPGAGYLEVEACVEAHAAQARRHGAVLKEREVVTRTSESSMSVRVETTSGVYEAAELVVTAGAWTGQLLPALAPRLSVHRVLLFWFRAEESWRRGDSLPCFGFDLPDGFYYGVPDVSGRGVKVGRHVPGEAVADPASVRRTVSPEDEAPVRRFVEECLPGLVRTPQSAAVCLYTMTPDEHFVVDRAGRTTVACGFSGHGFKFASVMGEVLADLATEGRTAQPIAFLQPRW